MGYSIISERPDGITTVIGPGVSDAAIVLGWQARRGTDHYVVWRAQRQEDGSVLYSAGSYHDDIEAAVAAFLERV